MRKAGGLLLVAVAGFSLGACGGGGTGSALSTRTGLTATRAEPTVATSTTTPTRTRTLAAPATTVATTVEVTTTAPAPPTTTRPALTLTVTPPTTSTAPATTSTPAPVAPPPTTTATSEPASSTGTPWGWIALVLAVTGGAILGIVLWSRSRSRASSWSSQLADLSRRTLVSLDDVLAEGSLVTGRVQALAAEARTLEAKAPDDRGRDAAARLRAGLDELAGTLEADRALRLGSPPPSQEQVTYSTALIRQQAQQLQGLLRG